MIYITSQRNQWAAIWAAQSLFYPHFQFSPLRSEEIALNGMWVQVEKPRYFLSSPDLWDKSDSEEVIKKFLQGVLHSSLQFNSPLSSCCVLSDGIIASITPLPWNGSSKDFSWHIFEKIIFKIAKKEPSRVKSIYKQLHISTYGDILFVRSLLESHSQDISQEALIKKIYLSMHLLHRTATFADEVYSLLQVLKKASAKRGGRDRKGFSLRLFLHLLENPPIFLKNSNDVVRNFNSTSA